MTDKILEVRGLTKTYGGEKKKGAKQRRLLNPGKLYHKSARLCSLPFPLHRPVAHFSSKNRGKNLKIPVDNPPVRCYNSQALRREPYKLHRCRCGGIGRRVWFRSI